MNNLTEKIRTWSIDRNLNTADPIKQMLKLGEEFGEVCSGIARGDVAEIKDGIGDTQVVLTILRQQIKNHRYTAIPGNLVEVLEFMSNMGKIADELLMGDNIYAQKSIRISETALKRLALTLDTSIEECTEIAYNEIKDRKGRMVDGIFIKEADLK